jgi:ribonuclease D
MTEPVFTWIERVDQLPALASALAAAPWVALDTEANSMFVYREQVCLIQVNAGGALFLVDALALVGGRLAADAASTASTVLDALKPHLENPARPLYLHGGEYDVGCLRRDFGLRLAGVWDSQQAASMLGWEKTGYGAAVERVRGVVLDKRFTHYDWATRPLDPGAVRYALDDVIHLPAVCDHLRAAVHEADLDEEVAIANQAVMESSWSGGFDPAGFWRIKGLRALPPPALAILAALYAWRDGVARGVNQPPGRLLNNEVLLALARNAPTNFQLLKRIGLRSWFLAAHGEALIAAIRRAQSEPGPLPERTRQREVPPEEEAREQRLKDWRRGEAEKRKVPLQVVLPARALEYLKRHGAGDLAAAPQLGAKRCANYGDKLRALCG